MSDPSKEGGERGFVVIDKRGQRDRDEEKPAGAPVDERPAGAPVDEPSAGAEAAGRELPPPDLGSLLISLGTSALYYMGLVPDPQSGQTAEPNLVRARQAIDTVEMLQVKTQGNLDADEEQLLQQLLTDLRMRFVETGKNDPGGNPGGAGG